MQEVYFSINATSLFHKNIGFYIALGYYFVGKDDEALYRVFELVKTEAAGYGVGIVSSEIVGLTPMNALIESARYYLQLENFDSPKQVLENHLL